MISTEDIGTDVYLGVDWQAQQVAIPMRVNPPNLTDYSVKTIGRSGNGTEKQLFRNEG